MEDSMNQEPNQTLLTDTTRKYLCTPRPATPEQPSPAKQPRKFRKGRIKQAKHHTTPNLPALPQNYSSGLCRSLLFFNTLTFEEVTSLSQYESEVKRTVSIQEYRNWKNYETTFQYTPEQNQGFEPYIISKAASQKWVDIQWEKQYRISCEHKGPPRTPHRSAHSTYDWVAEHRNSRNQSNTSPEQWHK